MNNVYIKIKVWSQRCRLSGDVEDIIILYENSNFLNDEDDGDGH